jgi:hypothetical protein
MSTMPKKPAISPAFLFGSAESTYLRFLRAAARAALFRARVRAPLRADALRAALLLLPPLFLAALLRPRLFAAAMLSLHDEVELSPIPWWNRRVLHRVLTGTRVTKELTATTSGSLLVTRREYRMQEMCVQYFLTATCLKRRSLPKAPRSEQVRTRRVAKVFSDSQRSGRS